jgi:hypothetical protein
MSRLTAASINLSQIACATCGERPRFSVQTVEREYSLLEDMNGHGPQIVSHTVYDPLRGEGTYY